MRWPLLVALTFTLTAAACSRTTTHTTPTGPDASGVSDTLHGPTPPPSLPPPSEPTFIWVVVVGRGGACLPGASVEIVYGSGVGRRVAQSVPCSYWDPDYDAIFDHVNSGEKFVLRASAPGYTPNEQIVYATAGSQFPVAFELSPLR